MAVSPTAGGADQLLDHEVRDRVQRQLHQLASEVGVEELLRATKEMRCRPNRQGCIIS